VRHYAVIDDEETDGCIRGKVLRREFDRPQKLSERRLLRLVSHDSDPENATGVAPRFRQ
jgi:hypothetical protein